jgi:hypothetical protein
MKLERALVVCGRIALVPVEGTLYEAIDLRTGRKFGNYVIKERQEELGTLAFPIETGGTKVQRLFDLLRTLAFASSQSLYFYWNDYIWYFDSKRVIPAADQNDRGNLEATRANLQEKYEQYMNEI